MAGSQLLCFGEYLMYKGSNTYNINSCETIEVFYNLRIDYDKLRYAAHITKIIGEVTQENQNSYKILQLYLNTHPFDEEALALYQDTADEAMDVREEYESKYGPLTANVAATECEWLWINNPWPWERMV